MLKFRQFLKEANLQENEKIKIRNFLNSFDTQGRKNIEDWLNGIAFNFIANKANSTNSDFITRTGNFEVFSPTAQLKIDLEHIVGFFTSIPPDKPIKMSFTEAHIAAEKRLEQIRKKASSSDIGEEKDVVLDFKDGWKLFSLKNSVALSREGKLMNHCVGDELQGYMSGVASGSMQILSLRDPQNIPHATIQVVGREIKQIKGNSNGPIKQEYWKYIKKFLDSGKFEEIEDLKNIGLIVISGVIYSIFNIPRSIKSVPELDLSRMGLTQLPKYLPDVTDNFHCDNNQLTSLEGSPQHVGGWFFCNNNQLTSLEGGPQSVGGGVNMSYNHLTSLEGGPQSVGSNFSCNDNELVSLKGSPKSVGGWFNCSNNQLTSLKGAPQSINGWFHCEYNRLTSLEGSPKNGVIGFSCHDNAIKFTREDVLAACKASGYIDI